MPSKSNVEAIECLDSEKIETLEKSIETLSQ
jgi:hypothetical protein